jgi:hypothetical protein
VSVRYRVGEEAVNAHAGQQQRDGGEQAEHQGVEAAAKTDMSNACSIIAIWASVVPGSIA